VLVVSVCGMVFVAIDVDRWSLMHSSLTSGLTTLKENVAKGPYSNAIRNISTLVGNDSQEKDLGLNIKEKKLILMAQNAKLNTAFVVRQEHNALQADKKQPIEKVEKHQVLKPIPRSSSNATVQETAKKNVPGKPRVVGPMAVPSVVDVVIDGQTVTCKERLPGQLSLTPFPVPRTALASPWRSGNTWLRHLVQQATGA